jgi:predicted Zn-dependent protease
VGLRVFFTLVKTDVVGNEVLHSCAALFSGEKVLLVDPTYRWFGAPHKNFEIVDDLQAVVYHLNQFEDLARMTIASKLDPSSGDTQYGLALTLLNKGRTNEAIAAFNKASNLAPNDRIADYVRGAFALSEHRASEAIRFFRRSMQTVPEPGMSHYGLARALMEKGELKEARSELRATLQCPVSLEIKAWTLQALAQINEQIPSD